MFISVSSSRAPLNDVCVCVRAHIDAFQSDSVGVSHSV